MLIPTSPDLRRLDIRPGHWGQWLAIGAVGLVGFVVLALLLVFETGIGELDNRVLSAVISVRSPDLTAWASALTRLGSASVVVSLGVAAAAVLGLRSRRIMLPLALLGALAATASLVTILKIALDDHGSHAGSGSSCSGEEARKAGSDDHQLSRPSRAHRAGALVPRIASLLQNHWRGVRVKLRIKHVRHRLTPRIRYQRKIHQSHRHRYHRRRQQPATQHITRPMQTQIGTTAADQQRDQIRADQKQPAHHHLPNGERQHGGREDHEHRTVRGMT